MADNALGARLYDAGWRQGALAPACAAGVHFLVQDPLTKIAKAVKKQAIADRKNSGPNEDQGSIPNIMAGFGKSPKQTERLVIISQDCDIIKKPSVEPVVLAIRAFATTNAETLRVAGENSSQHFLLDPATGLVAEFGPVVSIEKPALATLTVEHGAPDDLTRQRFARWLGNRFMRPAIDDDVVGAVVKPILDNLRMMQDSGDPDLAALDGVQEIRLGRLQGPPPYDVNLLFVIPVAGPPNSVLALATLVGRLRGWFDPKKARLVAWTALNPYQISWGDALETYKLDLDYYTYQGRTVRGLGPLTVS